MRYADDQDFGADGFTAQERVRHQVLVTAIRRLRVDAQILQGEVYMVKRHCPAAVPALERAEANVVTAIDEMRRDLAVLMGDET